MGVIANILVGVVALEHIFFLILEMFLWQSPTAARAFNLTPDFATQTKAMAANQGLYNGFLAAGLIWGLVLGAAGNEVKIFFLACVVVAGLFGAATVSPRILFIQALPATLALIFLFLSK